MFYFYILQCVDDKRYYGYTNNLKKETLVEEAMINIPPVHTDDEDSSVVKEVKDIFLETFPEITNVDMLKKQDQFENWDSFSHLELVSKIEEKFSVNFEVEEIIELDTPQKFVDLINLKRSGK